jgi:predicted small lipoprotein YifL
VALISLSKQRLVRFAAIGALVLVLGLGLSACGRKGPLDPPPSAAIPQQQLQPADPYSTAPATPPIASPGQSQRSRAVVAPPPSGREPNFFLDWLLD